MSIDTKKTTTCVLIFLVFILLAPSEGLAASKRRLVEEGNKLYTKGDFAASVEKYSEGLKKDSESDVMNFNLGTAFYKSGEYEKSIEPLQKALLTESKELKEKAGYNLGNVFYKSGKAKEERDLSDAIDSLQKSLAQYEQALNIEKKEDTQFNYEFVKKELERLKKKQENQKQKQEQQKQQNNQSPDQQQKSDDNKDQSEGQNQQNSSDDQKQNQDRQDNAQSSPSDQSKEDDANDKNQTAKEDSDDKKDNQNTQQNSENQAPQENQNGYNSQNQEGKQSGQAAKPLASGELTQKEAQMLLDNYQQSEEPKGLLNLHIKKSDTAPVLKDW